MRLSNIYLYLVKVGSIYLGMLCCRLEVVYAFLLSLVYCTQVEKSTFNLAWLTDIMGQKSGVGCICIFRNSHEIYLLNDQKCRFCFGRFFLQTTMYTAAVLCSSKKRRRNPFLPFLPLLPLGWHSLWLV